MGEEFPLPVNPILINKFMDYDYNTSMGNMPLDVQDGAYSALIDFLEQGVKINDRVEASFHFLKYHDCVNRESNFLTTLRNHLVFYCFPKDRYIGKSVNEICGLVFEGRDKFFHPADTPATDKRKERSGPSRSGELGELALYFLLESYLKAPQIVSKMSLKTTQGENFKGSDGIHIGIIGGNKCVFYCESKLNSNMDAAFSNCIASVIDFTENKKDFEISIINNHIDVKDPDIRRAVLDFLDPTKPKGDDWVEVHACFVGFNWNKFSEIEKISPNVALMTKLKEELAAEIEPVKKLLEEKLKTPENKLRYFFFVMPFRDIEKLRVNFMNMLYGE